MQPDHVAAHLRQQAASQALTPSSAAGPSIAVTPQPLRSALKRKAAEGAGTAARGGRALRSTPKSVHFALKRSSVLGESAAERPTVQTQPRRKVNSNQLCSMLTRNSTIKLSMHLRAASMLACIC